MQNEAVYQIPEKTPFIHIMIVNINNEIFVICDKASSIPEDNEVRPQE